MTDRPDSRMPRWLTTTWGKVVAVGAVLATVIGAVGIVVTITEAVGQRTTTAETVQVESDFVEDEGETVVGTGATAVSAIEGVGFVEYGRSPSWAVPADADFRELFAIATDGPYSGLAPGCTDEQAQWLDAHGVRTLPGYLAVELTNTATSGSALVVKDIRAEGRLTPPDGDVVRVGCERPVGGEQLAQYARLVIGADPFAVYGDVREGCEQLGACWYAGEGTGPAEPGTPVVFDLAPGEYTVIELQYETTANFTGRFVATVLVDGVESTLILSPGAEEIVIPHITVTDAYLEIVGGESRMCKGPGDGYPVECTVDEWMQMLTAAVTR